MLRQDAKLNTHQTKNSCTSKETINKMNRHLMNWKKIFVNHRSDKRLIFKTEKEGPVEWLKW
jgi:hypothetical protein